MHKILSIFMFAFGFAITSGDIYDNSWALIIGINKYQNVQKLDFAADDAIAMKDILIESFNFPEHNITILLNEEATKDNIVKEFSNVVFKAQEGDRVLVFFAGHGETMELPEGGQMGYLIPVNGDADNLYYSSIRMDELKSLALMSKAKHMLYLVDACYGGIAAVGSRGLSTNTPNYIDKIIKDKARQVITAGGKGEQVIEKSEWGHSAFTLNLKRGLKDGRADLNYDGYITANELGMFLSEKVTIDSENQQTPQYGRMTSQEGEFIFVYNDEVDKAPKAVNNDITDARIDALLTKLEKLESQSKTNEDSKLEQQIYPNSKQTDNPIILSFIYLNGMLLLQIEKYIDKRSGVGFGFSHFSWQGCCFTDNFEYPSYSDTVKFSQYGISTTLVYNLRDKQSVLFNPAVLLNLGIRYYHKKNMTSKLSDDITYFAGGGGLINRVHINKRFGLTFGLIITNWKFFEFNQNNELYPFKSGFIASPVLTFDINLPQFSKKKD